MLTVPRTSSRTLIASLLRVVVAKPLAMHACMHYYLGSLYPTTFTNFVGVKWVKVVMPRPPSVSEVSAVWKLESLFVGSFFFVQPLDELESFTAKMAKQK